MDKMIGLKSIGLFAGIATALLLVACAPPGQGTRERDAGPDRGAAAQPATQTPVPPEALQLIPKPQEGEAAPEGAAAATIPLPQGLSKPGATFILLRANDLSPDAQLNFMGSGFQPQEDIALSLDSQEWRPEPGTAPAVADKEGRINEYSLALPEDLAPGDHTLQVRGAFSGRSAAATFRLHRIPPKVDLDKYSLKPDQAFGFTGTGFIPGEEVEVRLGSLQGRLLTTVAADNKGIANGSVTIPLMEAGDFPLFFVGKRSQLPMSVGFNVQGFAPWVVLDNYSPPPYYRMGFAAEDFAPGEEVLVYLNRQDTRPVAGVKAGDNGKITVKQAFELPVLQGDNVLIFMGQRTGKVASAKFAEVPFGPSLELSAYAGRPGTPIAFIGSGWARSEPLQAFLGEGGQRQQVATFQSDPAGTFRNVGDFRIPVRSGPGAVPLTVVGDVSKVEVNVYFDVLKLEPSAELTAYEGQAGTAVSFNGHGFAGGEIVSVHLHDHSGTIVAQATADDDGTIDHAGSYSVTGNVGEVVPFVLVGADSGEEATTHFRIAYR